MIGRLSGTLVEKTLKSVLLDCGGVGYEVLMPLGDLAKAGALGEKATLRIHTHVREDALQLFGFLDEQGKDTFLTLLNVNGVGPKLALGILSGIEPAELAAAVAHKDLARLSAIPGVGKKTAERLCLELSGKLLVTAAPGAPVTAGSALEDLKSALLNLGYKPASVDKATKAVAEQARTGVGMDVLIREALNKLRAP
jgi:Holliday junction DNA helicase RuvA